MKSLSTALLYVIILLSSIATATTPNKINYQGRLTDNLGNNVPDGNYSVTFRIYDSFGSITPVWFETQSVATTDGLFAVLLGEVSPLHDTVFSSPTMYLGISVSPDPELTPRIQLVSVPFAQRVSSVDGSRGGSVSGSIELEMSTSANGNITKTGLPFLHNFGSNNTFVGLRAGNLTMSGSGNIGAGADAFLSNTTGNGNTALGYDALYNNQTGNYNTANGSYSMLLNTSGSYNTAFGTSSLLSNTIGVNNTAVGYQALYSNFDGPGNTATGVNALYSNTIGYGNTATGLNALYSNIDGYNNTAGGNYSLYLNTQGLENTAFGVNALHNNSIGNYNTAVGFNALLSNTTGYWNTAIGHQALVNNTGLANTASGNFALYSNTTGNENTVSGYKSMYSNTTGYNNVAIGENALYFNTTGNYNTACGENSLTDNITGQANTAIGAEANVSTGNLTNATAIGATAIVNASNKIRLGNTSVTVIEGQVAYTFTSDKNQKENFLHVDAEIVLDKLGEIEVTSWNYKGQDADNFRHYGPVAQDVFEAFGNDGIGSVGSPTTINSGDIDGLLILAIQALKKRTEEVEILKTENSELKLRLDDLESKISSIKY